MYAEQIAARHIFFAKKLRKYLEFRLFIYYLCDIKMISIKKLKTSKL